MPAPESALAHYKAQKAIANTVAAHLHTLFHQLDPNDLDRSWTAGQIGEEAFVTVSLGQQAAATTSDEYVDAVLAEQDLTAPATAAVQPQSFAGIASDGRSLETLLYESIIATKTAVGHGAAIHEAMATGAVALDTYGRTQIADAGRTAVGTAIAARPDVTSWTRMLNPPSCSRCVVLAGRVYRWNQGFLRHPRCDCVHIPTAENLASDITTDPRAYFDSLSASDQDTYFGAADAQSIRDGADIGQVVNVHRKGRVYQANGQSYTTESTSKRGSAPGAQRPMPETIYANADNRADAIEQLRTFGYLA
jgi:hypothetical protein